MTQEETIKKYRDLILDRPWENEKAILRTLKECAAAKVNEALDRIEKANHSVGLDSLDVIDDEIDAIRKEQEAK